MSLNEKMSKEYTERKLEKIKNYEWINPNSKEAFLEYVKFKQTERITSRRLSRILDLFYHILKNFDYDFSKLTQKQANEIWNWIGSQKWKEWTKYTYSRIFKNFITWLNETYGLSIKTKEWKIPKPKTQ